MDEPLTEGRIGGELGRQELQRDLALGEGLVGEVDDPHAAATDLRLDAETGDLPALVPPHQAFLHPHEARRVTPPFMTSRTGPPARRAARAPAAPARHRRITASQPLPICSASRKKESTIDHVLAASADEGVVASSADPAHHRRVRRPTDHPHPIRARRRCLLYRGCGQTRRLPRMLVGVRRAFISFDLPAMAGVANRSAANRSAATTTAYLTGPSLVRSSRLGQQQPARRSVASLYNPLIRRCLHRRRS